MFLESDSCLLGAHEDDELHISRIDYSRFGEDRTQYKGGETYSDMPIEKEKRIIAERKDCALKVGEKEDDCFIHCNYDFQRNLEEKLHRRLKNSKHFIGNSNVESTFKESADIWEVLLKI